MEGLKKDKEKTEAVITAVYKVNLHCRECARSIRKPLLATQGVQSVDIDIEKDEIKVKGIIQVIEIHELIKKFSKKKVELISPDPAKVKAKLPSTEIIKPKEAILRTTLVKVHMHCSECECDLRTKLLKHKGIHSVKTDMKAQTLTVQGSIESDKLVSYLRKKVHKHAEIITTKTDQKNVEKEKVEVRSEESTKLTEFRDEVKVEVKSKESSNPYFIHYAYAPQLFSDENPNACSVM